MTYRKILLLVVAVTCLSIAKAQTVHIADNNYNAPAGANNHTTIQAAVDAATAGDIIYIQPSPTTYGNATITKELHIKGIGFELDKDLPHLSSMGDLLLWNNIDNTSNASNSTLTGVKLKIIRMGKGSGGSYILDQVTISNCLVTGVSSYSISSDAFCGGCEIQISNLELYDNDLTGLIYFQQPVISLLVRNNLIRGSIYLNSTAAQSAIISNNIIYGGILKKSVGDNVIIQNNNFIGAKSTGYSFLSNIRDAIIANNIFYGRTPSLSVGGNSTSANFQGNIFTNNLVYETGNDAMPPSGGGAGNTGSGNIVSQSPLFTDVLIVNSWSSLRDFSLQSGSPATNAGSDGSDMGITGGTYPLQGTNFQLKTAAMPTIQIFNTDAIINPGDNLDIRVKIKAN